MKPVLSLAPDIPRRTFLHRSACALATCAALPEHAQAEPENTYGVETPELRSRAEVAAVLGKAPKPQADASLRPLTILFAGGAKDHPPRSHSHDGHVDFASRRLPAPHLRFASIRLRGQFLATSRDEAV